MTTPAIRVLSATALGLLALAASAVLTVPARAEDDPHAPHAAPHSARKVDHPTFDALVGSWNASTKGMRGESAGVAHFGKAADGTALVWEIERKGSESTFHGLGVLRFSGAGDAVRLWWFDTMGVADVTVFHGAVTAEGWDLGSEVGFAMKLRKTEAGWVLTLGQGDTTYSTTTYTKSEKPVAFTSPSAPKEGLLAAAVGDWTVAGAYTMPGAGGKPATVVTGAGTARWRWSLGGAALVEDYDVTVGTVRTASVLVLRAAADAKTCKAWGFVTDGVEPTVLTGPVEGDTWTGTGAIPGGGELTVKWSRKGEQYLVEALAGGQVVGTDTFTRKK